MQIHVAKFGLSEGVQLKNKETVLPQKNNAMCLFYFWSRNYICSTFHKYVTRSVSCDVAQALCFMASVRESLSDQIMTFSELKSKTVELLKQTN